MAENSVRSQVLLSAVTATGASDRWSPGESDLSFQAWGTTSSGSGSATIKIQVSNSPSPASDEWDDAGTITLSLSTTKDIGSLPIQIKYLYYRANVTAISGTGAAVTVYGAA